MGDVMDSTLMHINKGNAQGTQRERTKTAQITPLPLQMFEASYLTKSNV